VRSNQIQVVLTGQEQNTYILDVECIVITKNQDTEFEAINEFINDIKIASFKK
jgi:hypothetical protein